MRGSWRPNRTVTYWPPTLMAISVSFPFSWAAQPGAWGPSLSGCWFSLPHLVSNLSGLQTDWISYALSYMIVQRPPSCGRHNFALIQPVHGQGCNILIFLDRIHLLFTQVHFLFWQPSRVVGQYTTVSRVKWSNPGEGVAPSPTPRCCSYW